MKLFLDEKGVALPLVLMILFILTLLGTTIFMFNMSETKQVALTEDKMKAHYVARSGAHAVAAYLIENPEKTMDLVGVDTEAVKEFGEGKFAVDVNIHENPNEIYVRSTGTVNGSEQTVLAIVRDVGTDFPLFGDTIGFQGEPTGTKIKDGDVYYRTANNIENEDIVEDGDIIQLDRTFPPVILPCEDEGSVFYGDCPGPNNVYDGSVINSTIGYGNGTNYADLRLKGQIGGDMVFDATGGDNILIKTKSIDFSNNDLVINLNNNVVAIVLETFEKCGDIILEGDGHLAIYVNQWKSGGNFEIDHAEYDVHVNVFVYDEPEEGLFKLHGTPNFYGAIYAPNATFDQKGSGKGSLTGWVIANEFSGGAGMELYFYPYELIDTGLDLTFLRLEEWHDLN